VCVVSGSGDLIRILTDLLKNKKSKFDRIMIETTGTPCGFHVPPSANPLLFLLTSRFVVWRRFG
jgi:hypothetical protein